MKIIRILLLLTICTQISAQETFPVNGVVKNFEPIHAFINAHIILSPTDEINNGSLLIKGDRIIAVDRFTIC